MGISIDRHQAHLAEWLEKFSNYKKKWPKHLFRHEPVENVIEILKVGVLVSRDDAAANGLVKNDIAPTDIIQNRSDAHGRVRLYFRPRTPTQFHIEGIRKSEDYYMGRHAGLLVMLAFDGETVLTTETTQFSNCNMQSPAAHVLDGDAGFDDLDFSGIYHDEAYPSDDEKRKRCAEVLAQSPLDIASALKAILVRTDAEVATLRFLLTREGVSHLCPLVKKSQGTGIFFQKYTALEFVDVAPGRINFKLKGSASNGDIHTELTIFDEAGQAKYSLVPQGLRPYQTYFVEHKLPTGRYRIVVWLEGCYAHESLVELKN